MKTRWEIKKMFAVFMVGVLIKSQRRSSRKRERFSPEDTRDHVFFLLVISHVFCQVLE